MCVTGGFSQIGSHTVYKGVGGGATSEALASPHFNPVISGNRVVSIAEHMFSILSTDDRSDPKLDSRTVGEMGSLLTSSCTVMHCYGFD